jgi:F-type H+-transporting ATPase subunit b
MKHNKKFWFCLPAIAASTLSLRVFAAEAGLPQLDTSTWPSQIFWLIILFGCSYLAMAKVVTPRIGRVLEERRNKLDDDLGKARAANEDASRIREEYEKGLETARNAAAESARKATAEASKNAKINDAKIVKRLADKVRKAEITLAEAGSEAIQNLNIVAAEVAVVAVSHLTDIKVTASQATKTANRVAAKIVKQESS